MEHCAYSSYWHLVPKVKNIQVVKKGHPWPKYKYTSNEISFILTLHVNASFLYRLEPHLP